MKTADQWYHQQNVKFGASSDLKASKRGSVGVLNRGIDYHRWVYKALRVQQAISFREWELLIEPWFKCVRNGQQVQRSPDSVLINHELNVGIVIEVKMNWKGGRDQKLLDEYLPIVSSAFGVKTYPLLLTNCLRGCETEPLLGLGKLLEPLSWTPADPTPIMLVPRR